MISKNLVSLLALVLCLTVCGTDRANAADLKYKRTIESYSVPDVVLINQNGAKVKLKELLQSNKPIVMDFIFGTCTTICPVLSAGFVNFQNKIGPNYQNVHLISISIDPENDTPKVLKDLVDPLVKTIIC